MHIKNQFFTDIIHHANALDFWHQEYNQLSELAFSSSLQDFSLNGLRIFREKMNSRVAQCTKTPPNTVNILIPIHLVPEKEHIPTHTLYAHGATLLPSQQDFFFCTPPDIDYIVISLHTDLLQKRLIQQDLDTVLAKRFGCGVVMNQYISKQLVKKSIRLLDTDQSQHTAPDDRLKKQLCDEISDLVLHYFNDFEDEQWTYELGSNHHHILQYVYSRVLETEGHVTVLDLCQELQIPQRSLHYAFAKTTGMSPHKYIRALRLNAADRMMHQPSDVLKLTDLAYQYGFSHSSHFGREYKKLFGRTPSHITSLYT